METSTAGSELTSAQHLRASCSPDQLSPVDYPEPHFGPPTSAGDFISFDAPKKENHDDAMSTAASESEDWSSQVEESNSQRSEIC